MKGGVAERVRMVLGGGVNSRLVEVVELEVECEVGVICWVVIGC